MAGSSAAPTTRYPAFASFGEMLKYLRRRARMTQGDLSIAVGYSISQISRLEHNERLPDPATLHAVFIPVLGLEREPELVERLLELAVTARGASIAGPLVLPARTALHPGEEKKG